MTCAVEGCEMESNKAVGGRRGFCGKHYKKWLKYGNPLAGYERVYRNRTGDETCAVDRCGKKIFERDWCKKHYSKWLRRGDPLAGYEQKHKKGEGTIRDGYRVMQSNKNRELEHRQIIEKALGHAIPENAVGHHVDNRRLNNKNTNLVLCDSRAYHNLLHQRQKALRACGHAGWRKCGYCHKYDDPAKMWVSSTQAHARHLSCFNKYRQGQKTK